MKRIGNAPIATLIFHIDLITDVLESLDPIDLVLNPIPSAAHLGNNLDTS
jgi:hypothetical protein